LWKGTEGFFDGGRLGEQKHTVVFEPSIIDLPGFRLAQSFVAAHDHVGGQKAQQAELREAAEAQTRVGIELLEPKVRDGVMNVALVGKRSATRSRG
jgi:hypothetical protein